jgi:1,4-dihydroxy-6-naphthoate synthase
MEDHVMQQHIDLYVNEYSVDLGEKGETAVLRLMQSAQEKGLIQSYTTPLWVEA